ncbi:MAG: rRNA pseudouridine synthase [Firmicutes bacterium]|nr:rRNA pseudouridine synthase [Bacillota bacterium]
MRLDKFLSNLKYGSRKDIREFSRKNRIELNGEVIKDVSLEINPLQDVIKLDDEVIFYKEGIVLMINKPEGVVSANKDALFPTVMDLIKEPYNRFDLNIAGRLDKDSEGLVLLVSDGQLLHKIIHPNKEVYKRYYVSLLDPITNEELLEKGIAIKDGRDLSYKTKPAIIEKIDSTHVYISIKEGKFHQVKRMFEAIQNEVIFLKRVSIGGLHLDETLPKGEYRECLESEIELIFQ